MVKSRVRGFRDLDVYRRTYRASVIVLGKVVPGLPPEERHDLADQMRRSSKAVPRLIAEGHAKRHQRKGFQKYIDDARAEANEMIVCLDHCIDAYGKCVDVALCRKLVEAYDVAARQLFKLRESWERYHEDATE